MKLNNSFFYTIREDIKDEESKSGSLLVRSGMIKKSSNGVYMYMPLGFKVLKNIEKIVRDEMDKSECQELLMPSLINEEVYINSGRRDVFGDDMFTLKDRYNRPYSLGPTHEELFAIAAGMQIKSYKDLPFNIYQMATKYRDEPRPRYGLIRVREFIMKDAYSFDADLEGLDKSYQIMYDAYKNIFDKVGIDYKIVKAATGAMGGLLSEEFQAVTDIGEDVLVLCDKCDYSSNIEVSKCVPSKKEAEEKKQKELIYTPSCGSIADIANYLNKNEKDIVKTLIYKADNKFYALLVPGNREINELKVTEMLKCSSLELASSEEVETITKANVGFAGPIGLDIPVIVDNDVLNMNNFVVGANKTDYHYTNVNMCDFEYLKSDDIKNVIEGDTCPVCGGKLYFKKGIEIGNIFKLGTKYSEKLNLYYTDKDNSLKPVQMGCYGIGLGRIIASVVEQNNDDKGIIWPINIAPYKVGIVIINTKDEEQNAYANKLYNELINKGIDTILDDRSERPGVKFNDMDLIGIPIRITVGKKIDEKIVEFKLRKNNEVKEIKLDDVILEVEKYL